MVFHAVAWVKCYIFTTADSLFSSCVFCLEPLVAWVAKSDCTDSSVIQRLHKKVCFVSQNSVKSTEETARDMLHEKSWTGHRRAAAGPVPVCNEEQKKHCKRLTKQSPACFWPKCQKQNPWVWLESLASSNTTCASQVEMLWLMLCYLRHHQAW